jgi:hypothetical protein
VDAGRTSPDLQGDRLEELALRERAVVGDVVRLADRAWMLEREQQAVDDVADEDERQGVVAGADDDRPAFSQPIGDPREVHAISGAEDLVRADDHGRQAVIVDHPSHDDLALSLAERVGIRERRQWKGLVGRSIQRAPVDAG